MIVVWPGHVRPGSQSDAIVQSIDFHPTLLEMAGLQAAAGQKFDGISIVPALKGEPLAREAIFSHFPHYTPAAGNIPGTWVRKGDWKLIRVWCDGPNQTDRFELYNLVEDVGEARDSRCATRNVSANSARCWSDFSGHTRGGSETEPGLCADTVIRRNSRQNDKRSAS